MAGKKQPAKGKRADRDPLAAYRRIRKPMPPPEKVIADKRRRIQEEDARRQVEETEEP
jgi:hypothetical protein